MIPIQSKYLIATEPLSFTNGATGCTLTIDTKGALNGTADTSAADYLAIDVAISRTNTATNVPSTFAITESDSTAATSYVSITGGSFTSAVTSMSTTGANLYTLYCDLRPRKRFIKMSVIPSTTQVIQINANLSRGRQSLPAVAGSQGVAALLVL